MSWQNATTPTGINTKEMNLIEYKNVNVYQESQLVLQDVNVEIGEGEFVYVTGKVGTGKSSFLKTLYGEIPVKEGEAKVMDYDMVELKRRRLPDLRKKLGIIFQDFQLLTDRTVEDNLSFVLKATGWKDRAAADRRIREVLEAVGMETKAHKMPHQLSGGEQQRIAIARALLNKPEVIIADEPTGNLDGETADGIMQLLTRINREEGTAIVMVTHNRSLFEQYPGRVFLCKDEACTAI